MVGLKKALFLKEFNKKEMDLQGITDNETSDDEIQKIQKPSLSKNPNKLKKAVYVSDSDEGTAEILVPKKKPYVMTEARAKNLVKAKEARLKNVEARQAIKKKEDDAYQLFVDAKKAKKNKSKAKKQALELKLLEESSSEEEEIRPAKKVAKKKKKVVYESSSDSDSEEEALEKRRRSKSKIVIINKMDKAKDTVYEKPPQKRNMFL